MESKAKGKRLRIVALVSALLLITYVSWYLYLRANKYLIHKYSTGYGHAIGLGDFNTSIYLLTANPQETARQDQMIDNVIMVVTWPLRISESTYHSMWTAPK
jgi:hypothetical protein